jgi:hypothetical protein
MILKYQLTIIPQLYISLLYALRIDYDNFAMNDLIPCVVNTKIVNAARFILIIIDDFIYLNSRGKYQTDIFNPNFLFIF